MTDQRGAVRVTTEVERKAPDLPRFVVVPASALEAWDLDGTTVVRVELAGEDLGRRTLKRWAQRNGWFFDLTQAHCRSTGVDAGDIVDVTLRRADEGPPEEIVDLVASDPEAGRRWSELTEARRRQVAEHVRSAKRAETRRRRARKALSPPDGSEG
ncbi:MAG: YdeI/OmpD-associated family protein [Longimicrobiales bacterium]|nr:YdeI/OmpD-associated family protein [Longimicrobiales bacterium]